MNRESILVIDDETQVRNILRITLKAYGYQVTEARTAREGNALAFNHSPDLILLDLGLPDADGLQVLTDLRKWYTNPVLILSVENSEERIIHALDQGADDYLTKPYREGELLARIRVALRGLHPVEELPVLTTRSIELDLEKRIVKKNGEEIKLTSTEYALLALLMQNEGKVLTHPFLLRTVWGPGYVGQSQYLRVFIAQLRKKLEDDPNFPVAIRTESGVGYRFVGEE